MRARRGVLVLGLEVLEDLGVVPVPEPEPRVDAGVAVRGELDGTGGRTGRCWGAASGQSAIAPLRTRGNGPRAAGHDGYAAPAMSSAPPRPASSVPADASAPPVATPIAATEAEIKAVAYDEDGLVPAIVQEEATGQVLMFAWMNEDALRRTFETGRTWFWSRSRQEYWCKGETSGDRQYVRSASYDCDMDVLLFVVEQKGRGACHTGERSCFFRAFGSGAEPGPV